MTANELWHFYIHEEHYKHMEPGRMLRIIDTKINTRNLTGGGRHTYGFKVRKLEDAKNWLNGENKGRCSLSPHKMLLSAVR